MNFKIVSKKIKEFKKYIEKARINENWHTRYNNLEKKYQEQENQIKELNKKIDKNEQIEIINSLTKERNNFKRQRDYLRKDNKSAWIEIERLKRIIKKLEKKKEKKYASN